jgi:predicted ArsR family transcriptional regulator
MVQDNRPPFIIKDREILKIVADPLRSQIIETLLDTPHTVKQVADKLGLSPSKLYYHFNLLEKHGVIEVVETRMVANLVEKCYQATSTSIEVAPDLMTISTEEGKAAVNDIIIGTIDTTRDDLLRSLQARYFQLDQGAPAHPHRVMVARQVSRITEAQAQNFQERLEALLKEFEQSDASPDTANTMPYAFTAAFYPNFYFIDENHSEENPNG